MNEKQKALLLAGTPFFTEVPETKKHQLESQILQEVDTRNVRLVLWCRSCRSRASIKLYEDDLLRDEQAIRHTIFELCEAHEHAWSTEENHDYTD